MALMLNCNHYTQSIVQYVSKEVSTTVPFCSLQNGMKRNGTVGHVESTLMKDPAYGSYALA